MRRPPLVLFLLAAAFASLAACRGGTTRPPERPNLLLVTLDTVRADRLGAYGYRDGSTPNFDRLAGEGLLVRQAVAVAPLTLPSHASLMTGQAPPRHGVRDNADYRLPEGAVTLAEHLRGLGYRTAASVGAAVLSSRLGIAQGFDRYDEPRSRTGPAPATGGVRFEDLAERDAAAVTDDALAALDAMGEDPFFLWIHYFDPHADYAPPEPWRTRFSERPYDGEIAWVDSQFGRVLDALTAKGLDRRTVVIVTSDHGESLGEHGEATHGVFVYDATVRVPWIVRFPGIVGPGIRYEGLMSGIDLAVSVLSLMGLPPMPSAGGTDHATGWRGGPAPDAPPAYAESLFGKRAYGWAALRSLRTLHEKFIEAPIPELYRLDDDPGELRNLAAGRLDDVNRWDARLRDAVDAMGRPEGGAEHASTAAEREILESLGYVGSAAGASRRGAGPDPKAMIGAHERYLEAQGLVARGRTREAATVLEEVLADDPANPAALSLLGSIRFAGGGAPSGLAALEEAARLAPGVFENQSHLANAYHEAGRFEDAGRAYRAALAIRPRDPRTLQGLGRALLASGDSGGAATVFREALGAGARDADVHASLGAALADAGDLPAAETELRAAVAADPAMAAAWNLLGVVVERSGRREEAVPLYDRALEADPGLPDALFNRGKAYLREARIADAARLAERLVADHPDYDQGWLLVANVRAAGGDRKGARAAIETLLSRPRIDPRLERAARDTLRKIES
jgi:arylsulfatase A-like enzyme/Flp pilus assembly protein TadD